MRFLKPWHFTNRPPSDLHLLDIAYVVVLLPLLLVIKVPMLLFMFITLIVAIVHTKPGNVTSAILALFGMFMIFLALYGAFNFAGLSRLKLFVEMLIYGLLIAVALQRMTKTINFYLLISPALFLALSLFFFHSIPMLIYVVVEIFILLWLILVHRMQSSVAESLRLSAMMFVMALPWVVLLFIFFPRISFEHASYGFRGEDDRRMGHDGLMHLDNKALLVPSNRIVMEVGFVGEIPPDDALYFRGSVLYVDKKTRWEPLPYTKQQGRIIRYQELNDIVAYKVSLYPTHKKWLYLLDTPFEAPEGASIDTHLVTTVEKPLEEPLIYEAGSALQYRSGQEENFYVTRMALSFDPRANPRTRQMARTIRRTHSDPVQRLQALYDYYKNADLTYTLQPDPFDLNNSSDSFLFDKRRGYCVHFANSFVTAARMAGLPARVVTGYKAKRKNSVENYLAVKESDAHAWAEVLLGTEWHRIETTATAAHIDTDSLATLQADDPTANQSDWSSRANLYLLYVKYQIETWILNYTHFRQMQLWDTIKNDPKFLLRFIAILALVIGLSIFLVFYFRKPRCQIRALCTIAPVLAHLEKEGFIRRESETLHQLFMRYLDTHPDNDAIRTIDRLYQQQRYARLLPSDTLASLEEAVKYFKSYAIRVI